MTSIQTKLTTSGNSVAVRLPKELLKMSGLGERVTLEARRGKIIISKSLSPRTGWQEQIREMVAEEGDPSVEFGDMQGASRDGLDDAPWEGPCFEEWQKSHDKIS